MKPVTIEEDLGAILQRTVAECCSSESEARALIARFRMPLLTALQGGLPAILAPVIQSLTDVTYVTVGSSRIAARMIDPGNVASGVPIAAAGNYALTFERVIDEDVLVSGLGWVNQARALGAVAHLDHALGLASVPNKIRRFHDKLRVNARNLVFIGDIIKVRNREMCPYIDLDDHDVSSSRGDDAAEARPVPVRWGYFDGLGRVHAGQCLAVRAVLVPGSASE